MAVSVLGIRLSSGKWRAAFSVPQNANIIPMSNKQEVKVYTFGESNQPVRVEVVNNEPWFVAKDVCRELGITNDRDAVAHLDDDEKLVSAIPTPGQRRHMNVVSESGLYHLIFQSRKPEARRFRRWVTQEVLPSIRQTGGYSTAVRPRSLELKPRERSAELTEFYRELRRWVTQEDEQTVADLMNVTRRHVHEVMVGRTPSYGCLCMLVDCAKDNRRAGVRRVEHPTPAVRREQVEQLRLEFMNDTDVEL